MESWVLQPLYEGTTDDPAKSAPENPTTDPTTGLTTDLTTDSATDQATSSATAPSTDPASHPRQEPNRLSAATADGGRIAADGADVVRLDADGHVTWRRPSGNRPRSAHVSGDRLLVLTDSYEYHAWGFLGPALLLDASDGRLVAELRGDRCAPLGDGRFVLGLEGYDTFDTWLHDRDGSLTRQWHSYGHYVPDPDGTVRVVECDRRHPTSSHVARLHPDGTVTRGPQLTDCQAPPPAVLPDGTLIVLDAGVLRAVDRGLRSRTLATLLPVPPAETYRFHGTITLDGTLLTATVTEHDADDPRATTAREWRWTVRECP